MNERIRELAKQAGIATNLDTDSFGKDPNTWVDYFAEKFAELIIEDERMMACELIDAHAKALKVAILNGGE